MPKEYTYKAENEMWAHSEDDSSDQEISKGCVVRLRVVNVNFKSKTALVSVRDLNTQRNQDIIFVVVSPLAVVHRDY